MSRLRKVVCRASRAHFVARPAVADSAFLTFHRFNLLTSVLLLSACTLFAQNGPFDFGDAPAPYPTLLSANGAYHQIVQGIFLGDGVTADRDGQPDPNANLDLADDGVTFLSPLVRGNVVKAFIVLADGYGASEALADEIKGHVRERLSAYAYPRRVEFVPGLPKTLTGKIRRIELRQLELEAA